MVQKSLSRGDNMMHWKIIALQFSLGALYSVYRLRGFMYKVKDYV